MTFAEFFQVIKKKFAGADCSDMSDPTRIQVNITGEAAGTFYIEAKAGVLSIEPFEYRDRDVLLTVSDKNFMKIVEHRLDPVLAFTLGKLKAEGDLGKAIELKKLIR